MPYRAVRHLVVDGPVLPQVRCHVRLRYRPARDADDQVGILCERRARADRMMTSRGFENHRNRGRQAFPLALFLRELPPTETRECVVLRALAAVGDAPLGAEQSLVFEFVQCRVKRSAADVEHVAGARPQALRDRQTMERFERQRLQDECVECALYEIGRLAHMISVTETMSEVVDTRKPQFKFRLQWAGARRSLYRLSKHASADRRWNGRSPL